MYVLVEIKGKQYKAEKGAVLKVDSFSENAGDKIELDKVLMVSDDKETKVGQPYVEGASVSAIIGETKKDKKVFGAKFKRRKGYRRHFGHRQPYTYLTVENITV